MKIDTARIVITWKCNLACPYCCNNLPGMREQFKEVGVDEIDYSKYEKICITGGEPVLLGPFDLAAYVRRIRSESRAYLILNTNGILLDRIDAFLLERAGLNAINVGLHLPDKFDQLISDVLAATASTRIAVRFNVWGKYADDLRKRYPYLKINGWVKDACDRSNEERFAIRGKIA